MNDLEQVRPIVDLVAQGLLVTLIVQGLRALNIGKADEQPRWALVVVGAIVYGVGLLTRNLSPEQLEIWYNFQPLVTVLLAMLVASGIFGYVKMLLKWRGARAADLAAAAVDVLLRANDIVVLVLTNQQRDALIARIANEFEGTAATSAPTPAPIAPARSWGISGGVGKPPLPPKG